MRCELGDIISCIRRIVPKEFKDFQLEHPLLLEQIENKTVQLPFVTSLEKINRDLEKKIYSVHQIQIEISLYKTPKGAHTKDKPYLLTIL